MNVKQNSKKAQPLKLGDIVVFHNDKAYGVHIVAAYGRADGYGLVSLADGSWSSVSNSVEGISHALCRQSAPCRITSNNDWTLVENDE